MACKNEDDPCNHDWAGPETPCQKPVYALGRDRCHGEYFFIPTMAERLFVRSKVSNKWSFYNQPEQVQEVHFLCTCGVAVLFMYMWCSCAVHVHVV